MSEAVMLVEFFGGPCDGYNMTMDTSMNDLPPAVAIPLNKNVFDVLDGQKGGAPLPCPTVAFYKLTDAEDGRYCYLGACRATDLDVKGWKVYRLAAAVVRSSG